MQDWNKMRGKKHEEKMDTARKMKRQQVKLQLNDSDDEDDSESIGNPLEYLGLVKKALF